MFSNGLLRPLQLSVAVCLLAAARLYAQQQIASAEDLRRLSIEDLAKIKVTSVSKTEEPLNRAAASIYVITEEAIRRSGANSIPEILRLAPNLQVARLDANTYAITARGFNQPTGTANKLLVLIDGRVVYSPLFSGTFWDAQKTFVDDIDRVEVISGPGGTLWGANAVNGVINIITKDSIRTRGLDVNAQAGTVDQRFEARQGGNIGATGSFRVYGLGTHLGAMVRPNGTGANDDWNHLQAGLRGDWERGVNALTFDGDFYRSTGIGTPASLSSGENDGGHLNGVWQRDFADGANLHVQAYADQQRRQLVSGIDARVNQYAFETQYEVARQDRNAIVLGAGYRATSDDFQPGPHTVFLAPPARRLGFANLFVQDTITVSKRLSVALGMKAERNTYTGLEWMPDARLSWSASPNTTLWAAISRAVRTPSRFDTDLVNPGLLNGNPDFLSEELTAYEAGYRALITPSVSVSVSAYVNSYDRLRTIEASGTTGFPLVIRNNMRGTTDGVEAWGDLSIFPWWRVSAGVEVLHKNLRLAPGSRDVFGVGFAGNDPKDQWSARSGIDFPYSLSFDATLRHVSRLAAPAVDSYFEADARIASEPWKRVTVALSGQNLLHAHHLEFVNGSLPPVEVPRSVTLTARWVR